MDPSLSWHMHPDDMPIVNRALWALAEIFFAAGAEKIYPCVDGIAPVIHSLEEAEVLRTGKFKSNQFVFGGNHAFCTTRMHGDPKRGVVDEDGRCHDVDNLYIADTGIFPQCPSVNPMYTGMALARRQARAISDRI
jgi:choline dehydrogenase-like flavoprotein